MKWMTLLGAVGLAGIVAFFSGPAKVERKVYPEVPVPKHATKTVRSDTPTPRKEPRSRQAFLPARSEGPLCRGWEEKIAAVTDDPDARRRILDETRSAAEDLGAMFENFYNAAFQGLLPDIDDARARLEETVRRRKAEFIARASVGLAEDKIASLQAVIESKVVTKTR